MTLSFRMLLAASSLALLPLAAHAADYEPPIVIDDVEEVVPVEVGSGWYLRGDIGYTFDHNFADYDIDSSIPGYRIGRDTTSVFGGGGFGYHFNDYLRMDLTAAYLGKDEAWGRAVDPFGAPFGASGSIQTTMAYGMATGYIDLGTYVGITPYIGAGAGLIYTDLKGSGVLNVPGGSTFASYRETDYSFGYTLNAGLAYRMTENLSLDVGYQYLNAPNAKHFNFETPGFYDEGFDMHQVKVGLRYDLW